MIEMQELHQKIDNMVVIDVRSQFEFKTLRIKGATNIPLDSKQFAGDLRQLRKTIDSPLVFYCNGRSCTKSYKAVRKAKLLAGIENSYAFDAGVNDWARAYPERAILLGKNPIDTKDLIDSKTFNAHLLDPKEFAAKINARTIVLDVRDPLQRGGASLFGIQEQRVSLSEIEKLNRIIEKSKRENKTLLIYDAVGRQVRWLQYQLEKKGSKKYYFMKGGAEAYYKIL